MKLTFMCTLAMSKLINRRPIGNLFEIMITIYSLTYLQLIMFYQRIPSSSLPLLLVMEINE